MLQSYNIRKKKKVKALFTSFPFVGLLNAAVSIEWLSFYSYNLITNQVSIIIQLLDEIPLILVQEKCIILHVICSIM